LSIHRIASTSLTFPKYRWVVSQIRVPQNHFADDLKGRARAAGIGSGISSEIMTLLLFLG
jgi:hypothetical protein